jgi:hypothetical protein
VDRLRAFAAGREHEGHAVPRALEGVEIGGGRVRGFAGDEDEGEERAPVRQGALDCGEARRLRPAPACARRQGELALGPGALLTRSGQLGRRGVTPIRVTPIGVTPIRVTPIRVTRSVSPRSVAQARTKRFERRRCASVSARARSRISGSSDARASLRRAISSSRPRARAPRSASHASATSSGERSSAAA